VTALRLYGIARADEQPARRSEDTRPERRSRAEEAAALEGQLAFRNLVALVRPAASARPALADDDVRAHHTAVAAAFARHGVLPAPPGTVFRSDAALRKWMELHYVTLGDALDFVDGRAAARVHVAPRGGPSNVAVAPAPAGDAAGDAFRTLRRLAAASVTLSGDGASASASFLVERARWGAFLDAVAEEDARNAALAVTVTGPWPPYDFVRMQFGG
jgi:hypothetical protein